MGNLNRKLSAAEQAEFDALVQQANTTRDAARGTREPAARQAAVEASARLSAWMAAHDVRPKQSGRSACRAGQRQHAEAQAMLQEATRRAHAMRRGGR